MTTIELKIPLSCRVNPDLKSAIEEEAQEVGLTTSKYLEDILLKRHLLSSDEAEVAPDQSAEIEELEASFSELVAESRELRMAIEELTEHNIELSERNETFESKAHLLERFDFDDTEMETVEGLLETLRTGYPGHEDKLLVLASLYASVKNERATFFIHTLKAYFDEQEAQNLEA